MCSSIIFDTLTHFAQLLTDKGVVCYVMVTGLSLSEGFFFTTALGILLFLVQFAVSRYHTDVSGAKTLVSLLQ